MKFRFWWQEKKNPVEIKESAATAIRAVLRKFSRPDGKEIITMVLREMNPDYHLKLRPYCKTPRRSMGCKE